MARGPGTGFDETLGALAPNVQEDFGLTDFKARLEPNGATELITMRQSTGSLASKPLKLEIKSKARIVRIDHARDVDRLLSGLHGEPRTCSWQREENTILGELPRRLRSNFAILKMQRASPKGVPVRVPLCDAAMRSAPGIWNRPRR